MVSGQTPRPMPSTVDDKETTTSFQLDMDDRPEDGKISKTLLLRSLSKVSNATYNTKKTMAQGMMDIALLTANANQLRYILEFRAETSANFVILLTLIVCSLVLQVFVGVVLIFNGRLDCRNQNHGNPSDSESNVESTQLNNCLVLGVFLITVVNIFIAAFTVGPDISSQQ